MWNAVMSQHMHDMTARDHVLTVLPLFHVGGLNIQTTPALQLGATVTLHPRFAPEPVLDAIERDQPTLCVLVPATIRGHDRSSALARRHASTACAPSPPARLKSRNVWSMPSRKRGIPVLQVYGSTETCPIAVYTRLSGDWRRPGSTGLPGLVCDAHIADAAGREAAIGEPGEVMVRGPNIFVEYWGDAKATAEALRDGWYHTGDIGTRDA